MKNSRTGEKSTAASTAESTERARWTRTARGPWVALCAVATVVLGPAAATASALDQANAAPLHHAVRADQPQAHLPADSLRRRAVG
ncbi:hypothetical protein ACWDZ8_39225 [Streptomyces sp. NPDC003233]